jgi:photosystem II stability/assembly factor-like uncharacterized protein
VVRSEDGGRSWEATSPTGLRVLEWTGDRLVGVTPEGTILWGDAAAASWRPRGELGGQPEALHAAGDRLFAAVAERGLLQSDDGGATWSVRLPVEAAH